MGVLEVIASSVIGGVGANHLVGLTIYKSIRQETAQNMIR
jgi:hypothetical protein